MCKISIYMAFEYDLIVLYFFCCGNLRKKTIFSIFSWKNEAAKHTIDVISSWPYVNLPWIERYFPTFIHKHEICVLVARCRLSFSLLFLLCVFSLFLCIWWLRRVASCYCRCCLWVLLFIGRMLMVCASVCAIHKHLHVSVCMCIGNVSLATNYLIYFISHHWHMMCACECVCVCAYSHFAMCHFIYNKLHTKLFG